MKYEGQPHENLGEPCSSLDSLENRSSKSCGQVTLCEVIPWGENENEEIRLR
jgi:hypothetical protein